MTNSRYWPRLNPWVLLPVFVAISFGEQLDSFLFPENNFAALKWKDFNKATKRFKTKRDGDLLKPTNLPEVFGARYKDRKLYTFQMTTAAFFSQQGVKIAVGCLDAERVISRALFPTTVARWYVSHPAAVLHNGQLRSIASTTPTSH